MLNNRSLFLTIYMLLVILLVGCTIKEEEIEKQVYLYGESTSWILKDYEVSTYKDSMLAGNGIISRKDAKNAIVDSFSFSLVLVIDGIEHPIHSGSNLSNSAFTVTQFSTGTLSSNDLSDFAKLDAADEIYMLVSWGMDKKKMKEKIYLYLK